MSTNILSTPDVKSVKAGGISLVRGTDDGYVVADVSVDGENVGAVTSYTFAGIREDHTITATFKAAAISPATGAFE